MLTPAQLAAREGCITASFLPQLMAGKDDAIHNKWLELIGDPSWLPEDLSDNWPVLVGNLLEQPALDWHERKRQHPLIRRGDVVRHPTLSYVACTLDAYREHDDTVIECKATGTWMSLDEVIAHYTPQVIVQRACVGCRHAALLIVHGTAEPVEYAIAIDPDYEAVLWQRVAQFQHCVETLTPPVAMPTVTPPEQWRAIDLDQDSEESRANWATVIKLHLETWAQHQDSAQAFDTAKTEIKALLPEDCRKLTFAGMLVTRARNRAVTIKRARA